MLLKKYTLDIIIVNWNSGNLLLECINSIKNAYNDLFILSKLIIVDNNSQDSSLSGIEDLDLQLAVIRNKANLGFSKACNQGAKNSEADFILFLNPDTKLFSNSLFEPILFLSKEENKDVGIVGVQLKDEFGNISRNCARFPTPYSMIYASLGLDKIFPKIFPPHFMVEWDHKQSRYVDQVMGSFFLIRRELFNKLQGYDERFFVYYEDLDLSYRASKLGYKSYYLASAQIYHKGGGTSENVKADRLAYVLHSKLLYSKKHFNILSYFFVLIITILIEPFVRIFYLLLKGKIEDVWQAIFGYKKLIVKLLS